MIVSMRWVPAISENSGAQSLADLERFGNYQDMGESFRIISPYAGILFHLMGEPCL